MPVPKLKLGQANRLLIWVKGDHGAVYLNGRELGAGTTSLPATGSTVDIAAIPDGAFANGSGSSAVVKLIRLQVFAAA